MITVERVIIGVLIAIILGLVGYYNYSVKPQGWADGFGQYNLVSFDHGRTWYECDRTDDKPIVLPDGYWLGQAGYTNLRPANPKLLQRVMAFDVLCDIASSGRQLDLLDKKDQDLLRNAGFTVESVKRVN